MGAGLLVVPALAGYLLITRLSHTRYEIPRQSGHHLFFKSALAGAVLMALAFLGCSALFSRWPQVTELVAIATDGSETNARLVVVSFVSIGLGCLIPNLYNWLPWSAEADFFVRRAAEKRGDFLEILLETAVRETRVVELSLVSGKVYIGHVVDSGITVAQQEPDISLIPVLSGYRDSNTRKLVITKDYTPTDPDGRNPADGEFLVVVPAHRVEFARLIDLDDPARFNPDVDSALWHSVATPAEEGADRADR